MKVAVTGASGFLGRHIVEDLLEGGHEVLAVARRMADWPPPAIPHIVSDYHDLPAADVLVHLAEQSSVQASEGDPAHHAQTVERTRALLEGGRFGRILYASSAVVYGEDSILPHHPGEEPRGCSRYVRTKLECERLVIRAGGAALRLGNVIGERMSSGTVLARVLAQIPGNEDLRVFDDRAVRDFVWVSDVAECFRAFASTTVSGAFNVGSGHARSVRELAEIALRIAGEPHRRITSETSSSAPSRLVLDISATEQAVGWKPRVQLDAAIRKVLSSRHD